MREYHYRVDREGRVFHDETEIVDPITLRFFVRAMSRTPDGRWLVVCQGEHNWFDAVDTPLVAQRLDLQIEAGGLAGVTLRLAGDVREPLDPATLHTDGRDLFCVAGRAPHPVRFGRVAALQLAPFLHERPDGVRVTVSGRAWPIRHVAPSAATSAANPAGAGPPP